MVRAEYPIGETPQLVATFIKQFLDVRGDFSLEFHTIGWIHPTDKMWWGIIIGFSLAEFENILPQAELYRAVRAVQYGIP